MKKAKPKKGRPHIPESSHKKNRAISLTDSEYDRLKEFADKEGIGVSAYVIKKLKLKDRE